MPAVTQPSQGRVAEVIWSRAYFTWGESATLSDSHANHPEFFLKQLFPDNLLSDLHRPTALEWWGKGLGHGPIRLLRRQKNRQAMNKQILISKPWLTWLWKMTWNLQGEPQTVENSKGLGLQNSLCSRELSVPPFAGYQLTGGGPPTLGRVTFFIQNAQ